MNTPRRGHVGGEWQLSVQLQREMPQEWLMSDVVTYNSAIKAAGGGGDCQLGMQMLLEMPQG